MTVTRIQGKANPFRNGPALLRSARADGWFPLMRDMTQRELQRMYRDAAERVLTFENPAPESLQNVWFRNLRLAEGRVTLEMVKEGFKDADAEFKGRSYGSVPILDVYRRAFQAKDITPDDSDWIQSITISEGIDSVEAEFLTVADFSKVEAHLNRVASAQTRRVARTIQGIFARAQAVETDPRKIAKSILNQGAARSRSQARLIARTETIWSYNEGAQQRYVSSGVAAKEWVVTRDDLLCPFCRTMDGKIVGVDGEYWSDGQFLQVQDNGKTRTLNFKTGVEHPPLHPNCVLPGTRVRFGELYGASRAWYEGPIIEIGLTDGRRLSVTANHMMLTPHGFASAELLRKGDQIIDCSLLERIRFDNPDNDNRPPMIEEVFHSLREMDSTMSIRVPVRSEHFHGEGDFIKGKINVVVTNGFLLGDLPTSLSELVRKRGLSQANMQELLLAGDGSFSDVLLALGLASDGGVGSRSVAPVFRRRALRHHQPVGLQNGPHGSGSFPESPLDDIPAYAEPLGKREDGFSVSVQADDLLDGERMPSFPGIDAVSLENPEDSRCADPKLLHESCRRGSGLVQTADILFCRRREFRGHVYDLHTLETLYTISGLLGSNCRCTLVPVLLPTTTLITLPI